MTAKNNAYIYGLGGAALIAGGLLKLTVNQPIAPKIFAFGAGIIVLYHFLEALRVRQTDDFQLKRLHGLCFLVGVLLIPAAYCMWKGLKMWLMLTLVYAVVIFFLSFRDKKK
jgi:phosphatidylserine synthase